MESSTGGPDLVMPVFKSDYMKHIFTTYVIKAFPPRKQVMDGWNVKTQAASLLTQVSHSIVLEITNTALNTLEPQIGAHFGSLLTGLWLSRLEHTYVTEVDIMSSLGDSVHLGLEAALGLTRKHAYVANKMKELIAVEVTRAVNKWMNILPLKTPRTRLRLMQPREMANLLAYALTLTATKEPEPCENKEPAQPDIAIISVRSANLNYSDEELLQRDRHFTFLFLSALIIHISKETKTSLYGLNLEGMLARLRENTVGQLTTTLPKNLEKIQMAVYNKLGTEFGPAKFLLWAMSSTDGNFEEAVANLLKQQLQEREKGNFVKKMGRFLKKRPEEAPKTLCSKPEPHINNGHTPLKPTMK